MADQARTGTTGTGDELRLVIPMLPDMELAAADAAGNLARLAGFSPERADEVRLAVVEACLNAFEHSRASERRVAIRFRVDAERLKIEIADNGRGFDPTAVPTPDIRKSLRGERKRGWGLWIMAELMDAVDVLSAPGGTTVVLIKARREGSER